MFIKPAPNPQQAGAVLVVRDPETMQPLPAEGREVPDHDLYWHRRIRDCDVIVVRP